MDCMTHDPLDTLDIHPASDAEREAAYRNVHEVWGRGLPIDEHVRQRLESPKHQSATWFVGCREGRVLTSLGAYPIELSLRGRVFPAVAIGSVHTLPECRGQGLAPRLLAWVERHLAGQGVAASLLYSDIDPQFYARLGYQQCPSWSGWHEITSLGNKPSSDTTSSTQRHAGNTSGRLANALRLEPFDPLEGASRMSELYARCHGRRALAIARNASYWHQLYQRSPDDAFYWLVVDNAVTGYVRLCRAGDDWRIVDHAVDASVVSAAAADGTQPPDGNATGTDPYDALYFAAVQQARRQGVARVGGWLPPDDAARRWFRLVSRSKEITMVKSLDPSIAFDEQALEAAAYFCEIDHV